MLSDLDDLKHPIPPWLEGALARPRNEGSVEVQECPIHYFSWGDPSNRPLVFLHGRMSHARCWAFIAPLLDQNYFCVAIDSSGMGDSGHREQYLRAVRAQEVHAVCAHLNLFGGSQRPLLVTHSYGAVIGLDVIARYKGAFAGIVACDPSLSHPDEWPSLEPRQDGAALTRPNRTHPDLAACVKRFRFAPPQVSVHPVLEEYIARHSLRAIDGGWCWKFDPLVYSNKEEGHDDWWVHHSQDFINSQTPRAIIYGDSSAMVTKQAVDAVVEQATESVPTYEIANAAHHLMVDQPHALLTAIAQAVPELLRQ